jgi:hypothetical protein
MSLLRLLENSIRVTKLLPPGSRGSDGCPPSYLFSVQFSEQPDLGQFHVAPNRLW